MTNNARPDLSGRRVAVPGGTGGVGEGVVRSYLAAGATVLVPTRSQERAEEFRVLLGDAASEHLHLVVHDYTSFTGAEALAAEMVARLGGVDAVIAPIGGWWTGKRLWEIDESDWNGAFLDLATAHMAVARAFVPRLPAGGTYTAVVGESASFPVPYCGLVSMQQAAVLMMHQVLSAEIDGGQRAFALVLGQVNTRSVSGDSGWITPDQIGDVAAALTATPAFTGQTVALPDSSAAVQALSLITSAL